MSAPTWADFRREYPQQLAKWASERAGNVVWPIGQAPQVAEKMLRAFEGGYANKDSTAVARTCRKLGIKHTFKAIRALPGYAEAHEAYEAGLNKAA